MYKRLKKPYPMARSNHRTLSQGYQGPVFIWDIDKTYLDTQFESIGELLKIPLELGIDKNAVTGAPELLQGLRDGPDNKSNRPLFFISASPHQIHASIERKMLLDGIDFDGISFKDPIYALKKGRFDELKNQVPYKLSALLLLALELPIGAELYLFGDDAEADADIYSLFADMIAGRIRGAELEKILLQMRVRKTHIREIMGILTDIPTKDRVRGILIRLTPPLKHKRFENLDPRILGWESPASCVNLFLELKLLSASKADRVLEVCSTQGCVRGMGPASTDGAWYRS
jgi:hypothetical protein